MQDVFEPMNFDGDYSNFYPINRKNINRSYINKKNINIATINRENIDDFPANTGSVDGKCVLLKDKSKFRYADKLKFNEIINKLSKCELLDLAERVDFWLKRSDKYFKLRYDSLKSYSNFLNYAIKNGFLDKKTVLSKLREGKNKVGDLTLYVFEQAIINPINIPAKMSITESSDFRIPLNLKYLYDTMLDYDRDKNDSQLFNNLKFKIKDRINNVSSFDGELDVFTSYFAVEEAPVKDSKFLGMPRKVGIGVTIGVGVLAIAGIVFAIVKKKK